MPCAAPPRSHSSEPSSAPCSSRSPPSSSSLPSSSAASLTESDKALSVLLGYSLGAAVVLPLDRLKSLMQVDEGARRAGAFGLARRIVRSNGVRGLYQGGGAHMLIAPYTIFYYLLYDGLQMRGRELTATPATREGHHLVPLGVCSGPGRRPLRMHTCSDSPCSAGVAGRRPRPPPDAASLPNACGIRAAKHWLGSLCAPP